MLEDRQKKSTTFNAAAGKNDSKPKDEDLKKYVELEGKCQEYLNGWKRAKADYENLKKETEKRSGELTEFVQAGMLLDILTIYDHYKLALSYIPKEQEQLDWVQGFLHIKKNFQDFFKQFDIEEIRTVGQEFNPEFHEAVSQEESDKPDGQIVKEVNPGYTMKDKVIRVAKVIVAKK